MSRCIVRFGVYEESTPLYRARVAACISLVEAAKHLGVSAPFLNGIEHGREEPSDTFRERAMKFYASKNP